MDVDEKDYIEREEWAVRFDDYPPVHEKNKTKWRPFDRWFLGSIKIGRLDNMLRGRLEIILWRLEQLANFPEMTIEFTTE